MHPTSTATPILAPSSKTLASTNTIEYRVGQLVAAAGLAIAEAITERANGGLTPATRTRGGDLIAELVGLRGFMIADWDFDGICREYGTAALQAVDVGPAVAAALVSEVLSVTHRVVRATLN